MDDYDEDLSTTYGDANPAVARLSIPASTKPVVAKSSFLRRLCGKRRSASQPSLDAIGADRCTRLSSESIEFSAGRSRHQNTDPTAKSATSTYGKLFSSRRPPEHLRAVPPSAMSPWTQLRDDSENTHEFINDGKSYTADFHSTPILTNAIRNDGTTAVCMEWTTICAPDGDRESVKEAENEKSTSRLDFFCTKPMVDAENSSSGTPINVKTLRMSAHQHDNSMSCKYPQPELEMLQLSEKGSTGQEDYKRTSSRTDTDGQPQVCSPSQAHSTRITPSTPSKEPTKDNVIVSDTATACEYRLASRADGRSGSSECGSAGGVPGGRSNVSNDTPTVSGGIHPKVLSTSTATNVEATPTHDDASGGKVLDSLFFEAEYAMDGYYDDIE